VFETVATLNIGATETSQRWVHDVIDIMLNVCISCCQSIFVCRSTCWKSKTACSLFPSALPQAVT